ncbi:glutaminase family protein [Haloferula sargassicola]|uniref:Glutaminase n=1 Tax=Haloferula sargassicola TaxID=490096 RepID=A0ABP9UPX3_9BACT
MKILISSAVSALTLAAGPVLGREAPSDPNQLIPPATPLVACDPYFSIWSPADHLTDTETTHWTGRRQQLSSLVKIDGKSYRLMGSSPASVPALEQTDLSVFPTRTVYRFEGEGVEIGLTFMTPALPEDMALLSRPVTYLTYEASATDGKEHTVSVFFAASGELTVNETHQAVQWEGGTDEGLSVLKIGSKEQRILGKKGDDLRIDWGFLYVAAPKSATETTAFAKPAEMAFSFATADVKATSDKGEAEHADQAGAGLVLKELKIGEKPVSTWLMLAYDDIYSIQYNHTNLRPYWRKDGWEAKDLLAASAKQYEAIRKHCEEFDKELFADLEKMGGIQYAKLSSLAYRQCFAAGKFVADQNGQPLQFSKENHSNGCIATSDVFYPMAPQFLLMGPTVAKSFIVPFMEYAKSDRWKFPFAPHDLGTYPLANGQVYGGGETGEENQMPVEESGNLLILFAAVAEMEGNAGFAEPYWERLEQWANYLKKEGFDPPNQLCTDDFAGHLAHNVNLSAKAICGLASFAKLCEMRGDQAKAKDFLETAKRFAERWVVEADDGDHYRLAFDRADTWSQKYNLVWDRILGFNLFPEKVFETEMTYYKSKQNEYGLPLDNRSDYTKLDWILWTATLTEKRGDFDALVSPVFRFLNETPDRSPMTDWYFTSTAKKRGFTARPVVGGVFLRALYDKEVWKKYAGRDRTKAAKWAPMPEYIPPVITPVVEAGDEKANIQWAYTFDRPDEGWMKPDFDAGSWKTGAGGFGADGTPNAKNRTKWTSGDIWIRREFELPTGAPDDVKLWVFHDEEAQIFINGVSAATLGGFNTSYEIFDLSQKAKAALKRGKNTLAIHCHQTQGGQYIDAGLVQVKPGKKK